MVNKHIAIRSGLRPLPRDDRDFPLGGIFKLEKPKDIPNIDFIVTKPLVIKDQKDTDMCTAYAVTAVSEDQEGVELSPEYQFAKTKELDGNKEEWGADLRTACKSATKYGSLPQIKADTILKGLGIPKYNRDQVVHITWNGVGNEATSHAKRSYFRVDTGRYDIFDNIRSALYTNRDKKATVVVGALWRNAWTYASKGVIPKKYSTNDGFGHAFKIYGQKNIDGEMHLVAQLSNGTEIGDQGIFYFPREVVNSEFTYGAFMFVDIDRADVEVILTKKSGIIGRMIDFIVTLFSYDRS